MKLPLSWLADWLALDASPETIADALTRRGFYVEGIEEHGRSYPGVVVARVLEVAKHPNADKLSLCRVDSGGGVLNVVCGAPNVAPGMIAPLATVGAMLPGGVVIRKSRIRGEESQGMLCSPRELELSDEHAGILDLAQYVGEGDGLVPGRPLDELMPPPDAVLEVEVPFNRPDGLGIVGLAREVHAALGGRWTADAQRRLERSWEGGDRFPVTLEDAEGCPLYLAQAVEGVAIGPSPKWLVRKLELVGQRSVNNLVDLTNLVLFELGQPVHAFDLETLHGPEIRVRRARAGERIVTLDGRERELSTEVLVIGDRDRAAAIAGIMGGAETEVTGRTRTILLESAWFDPRRVRRGSKALGLATEASRRFERGVDPRGTERAMTRFLELVAALFPQAKPTLAGAAGERAPRTRTVTLRASRVERVAGLALDPIDMERHLEALGFRLARDRGRVSWKVEVPTWRPDVTLEDDLVEEVARAHGYDAIPEAPLDTRGVHATRDPRERGIARARAAMLARGLDEAWTTTLVSESEAQATAPLLGATGGFVRLANPVSRESEVLRPNPVAGLLRACAHNLRQGVTSVRLFEVGAGFAAAGPDALPAETPMIAAIVTGARWAHAHDATQEALDFADAKGLWEAWLGEMRVDTPRWATYSAAGWKPGASAEVAAAGSRIGWAGTLGQPLLRQWDIEVPVQLFVALL